MCLSGATRMNESTNQNKSVSERLLKYSCEDIDCPYEPKDEDEDNYYCCQYCFHIPDSEIRKKPQDWKCNLPNREAQRRHYASLTEKQKVLL
jgi:hypothetical protein